MSHVKMSPSFFWLRSHTQSSLFLFSQQLLLTETPHLTVTGLQSVFESPLMLMKPLVFGKAVWKDLPYRDKTMLSAKGQIVKQVTQVREQSILLVQSETNLVMTKSQNFGLWKEDVADKQGIARTTGEISSCLHLWFFTRGPHSSPPDSNWPKYVHPGPLRPEPAPVTLPRL